MHKVFGVSLPALGPGHIKCSLAQGNATTRCGLCRGQLWRRDACMPITSGGCNTLMCMHDAEPLGIAAVHMLKG